MHKKSLARLLFLIFFLTCLAAFIALPKQIGNWQKPALDFYFFGQHIYKDYELKQGLDIQGGMQVTLRANMDNLPAEDHASALESAREIIARRIDLYGVGESTIRTARQDQDYRLVVELPGIDDPAQALQLLGSTAQLSFRLQTPLDETLTATASAETFLNSFSETGLTGKQLKRAMAQLDPQSGRPTIALEMNAEGRELFAQVTKAHMGEVLAIFIDDVPLMMPVISATILDGRAVITGDFTVEEAKNLSIQLNAGALPVAIEVLEQKSIGASLGADSIAQSVRAGLIGLALLMVFMVIIYGWLGVAADLSLLIYAVLTLALYKVFGVVLTLPGIAGLILTIGMAVDANILIFERMKEELRAGSAYDKAMELGFGRAWDSIKDANLASILTALVLINPLNWSLLNTSGAVRGFGMTFLLGTLLSLFTGVVVSRLLLRALLPILRRLHR